MVAESQAAETKADRKDIGGRSGGGTDIGGGHNGRKGGGWESGTEAALFHWFIS